MAGCLTLLASSSQYRAVRTTITFCVKPSVYSPWWRRRTHSHTRTHARTHRWVVVGVLIRYEPSSVLRGDTAREPLSLSIARGGRKGPKVRYHRWSVRPSPPHRTYVLDVPISPPACTLPPLRPFRGPCCCCCCYYTRCRVAARPSAWYELAHPAVWGDAAAGVSMVCFLYEVAG